MSTVTVSPKFQVVIPKVIREKMHICPGEKLEVISYDGRIELVRVKKMKEMKGFLKGLDLSFKRDKKDRV
ncbi:MAG: AbrB/MazE/SpoVT family DNA-binding domain-containing protein [Planctomycetota bacterium]